MLERAFIYRVVFTRMVRIGNASTPQAPTEDEWSTLEKIRALLRPFDAITKRFSGRKYPTANLCLMHVWTIESLIRSYFNNEDETLNTMGKKMKDKFDKYWESYNMILSLAAIFDSRLKLQFVKFCFTQLDARSAEYKTKQVKEYLFKLFEEYATIGNVQDNVPGVRCESNHLDAFSNFDRSSFQGRTQLDDYLDDNSLDDGIEIPLLQDPNIAPQEISDDEYGEDEEDFGEKL
ncbi:hypothetical protein SOVF_180750 [Spinacia oleracea]|nr:hypothetical protein SOVF_180750 [Spinacia oleracea]